jgi:hypothetical protein
MDDRQDFCDAMTEAAWTVTDPESDEIGRRVLHTFVGGMGADWDLIDALGFVMAAKEVAWSRPWAGHELYATDGIRHVYFGVEAPKGALPPDSIVPWIE